MRCVRCGLGCHGRERPAAGGAGGASVAAAVVLPSAPVRGNRFGAL